VPQTPLRELTALPIPPSWFKGPTLRGRGGEETEGERRRGEWRGEREAGGRPPNANFWIRPVYSIWQK